jgi:membrane-associated protease RseP (regulator of RpoE activity)
LNPFEFSNFSKGLTYSFLLLVFLGSHEFGHYFAARHHGVRCTLPFFLPFPSFLGMFPFGTLGAVILIRSQIQSRKALFDIGAAGPIAGFIVSLAILAIGFTHLPPKEYLYTIHPEYAQMKQLPTGGLTFGTTSAYWALSKLLVSHDAYLPAMNEMYHYPFLCVGWFGLFVTALNLIPIGQLDGGHISTALFGARHRIVQIVWFIILSVLGLLGSLPLLGISFPIGWLGWLFWAILLLLFLTLSRFRRPPVLDETPLDPMRTLVGWICVVIFLSSFSLSPFSL